MKTEQLFYELLAIQPIIGGDCMPLVRYWADNLGLMVAFATWKP